MVHAREKIGDFLRTIHARFYANKAPSSPTMPFGVYKLETVMDSYPSEEMYLNVWLYEREGVSSFAVEEMADNIIGNRDWWNPTGLDNRIIEDDDVNLHIKLEQRQSETPTELTGIYLINLRFVVRAYRKDLINTWRKE